MWATGAGSSGLVTHEITWCTTVHSEDSRVKCWVRCSTSMMASWDIKGSGNVWSANESSEVACPMSLFGWHDSHNSASAEPGRISGGGRAHSKVEKDVRRCLCKSQWYMALIRGADVMSVSHIRNDAPSPTVEPQVLERAVAR